MVQLGPTFRRSITKNRSSDLSELTPIETTREFSLCPSDSHPRVTKKRITKNQIYPPEGDRKDVSLEKSDHGLAPQTNRD